jgi:hypothetical protein
VRIEIPTERDTILVLMDNKVLPLESLGTGISEVVILAAAATLLENHVLCIEEPELHLNPVLQKKLVRYLSNATTNQYFITTHSAALMDTPGAEIYHVRMSNGCSVVERATSDSKKSAVCHDLGYHPSDLLQANCIVWVEGPTDRVYLTWWLKAMDAKLIEGIHYSVMFYGGRLASHLSNAIDDPEVTTTFIGLRQLNRRGAMLLDSDRSAKGKRLNETKVRLKKEFETAPGYAWVTDGREIENYLPAHQIKEAISKVCSGSTPTSAFGKYDHTLELRTKNGKPGSAPKVAIARFIAEKFEPDLSTLDLKQRLSELCNFIAQSNPGQD